MNKVEQRTPRARCRKVADFSDKHCAEKQKLRARSRVDVIACRSRAKPDQTLRLDDYLPYRLSVAANEVSDLISRAYRARFGLNAPQWRLIAVLAEDGPLTQQALCVRTVMDKVVVSRAAASLHDRDLVQRAPSSVDGRSHCLDLTKEGRRLYGEVAPEALFYETRLLQGFSIPERRAAHDLLRRLEAAAMTLRDEEGRMRRLNRQAQHILSP